jgi:hypothetical protein
MTTSTGADPEAHLGDPGRIRVVDHADLAFEGLAQLLRHGIVHPRRVDVGGRQQAPVHGDTGKADADGRRIGDAGRFRQAPDQAADGRTDGIRGGGLRRRHPQTLRPQSAGLGVHDGRLDATATDIHPDGDAPAGHVRIRRFDRAVRHRSVLRSS